MRKVYIVGGDILIERMFRERGWEVTGFLEDSDLVQFTGGEDVTPALYGEERHKTTHSNILRDIVEAGYYQVALMLKKPMAGICRGGQFLNVMNGGKLFQNVNAHAIHGYHDAYVNGGKSYKVTSTHHQMMRAGDKGEVVLYAKEANKLETDTLTFEGKGEDTEAVVYQLSKTLCFQPHPEYVKNSHECRELYFNFLNRYLGLN